MTEAAEEPPWHLLPQQPAQFFGLSDPFDRTDLKRRYHLLLRRFKPEKFPAEFQLIRAAYELLDGQLRYRESGETSPFASPGSFSASESAASSGPRRFNTSTPHSPQTQSVVHRLRKSLPSALQQELIAKSNKTPEDYLLLALLNDSLGSGTAQDFLEGLLAGLKAFPQDRRLRPVFREFLRSAEARANCEPFLQRIFAELPRDFVFESSEPLWDELVLRVPFPRFETILRQCLDQVHDYEQGGRLVFELHLVKRVLFRASQSWIVETLQRLRLDDVNWPRWCDQEMWLLERLARYCEFRPKFLDGSPLRARFDDVLRAYCEDDREFQQKFLNLQVDLARDVSVLDTTFPPGGTDCTIFWNAWSGVCNEFVEPFRTDPDFPLQRALESVRYIPSQFGLAPHRYLIPQRNWRFWEWFLWLVALIGGPLTFLWLVQPQPLDSWTPGGRLYAILIGLPVGVLLQFILKFLLTNLVPAFPRRIYRRNLRPALISFLRSYPLPIPILVQQLMQFEVCSGRLVAESLRNIDNDVALKIFALAVRITS